MKFNFLLWLLLWLLFIIKNMFILIFLLFLLSSPGGTASYDESCSSTLASTFSNGKTNQQDAGVVGGGGVEVLGVRV